MGPRLGTWDHVNPNVSRKWVKIKRIIVVLIAYKEEKQVYHCLLATQEKLG